MSALIDEATELLRYEHEDATEDAGALADVAVRLAGVIDRHQKVLDEIKVVLRERAREVTDGSRFHWHTDAGSTSVTFPDPRWKVRKGTDWNRVKDDFGDTFDVFFDTRVSYAVRKDIESIVKRRMATGDDVVTIMDVIERDEPTPRVGFKPRKGDKR